MKQKLLLIFCFSLFLFSGSLYAQSINVTGTVKNENGEAIAGASVTLKGAKAGTIADDNGEFRLSAPQDGILVISAINYLSKEIPVSGRVNVILTATEGASGDDVVVTGYTNIDRSRLSSSVSIVDQKDIANTPYADVNQVLQGRAAGVFVGAGSGQPGATQFVRIRGVGSISAGAAPLYVIDGVIIDRGDIYGTGDNQLQSNDIMSSLNPNDIESVSVLKDAAATSIYGSRGANGVIVITTKSGKAGKSEIAARAQFGSSKTSFGKFKFMTPAQTLDYYRDVYRANGATDEEIEKDFPMSSLDNSFDWAKAAFITGHSQDYGVSVSGGTEKAQHYTSIGYLDQDGTILGSGLQRFSIVSNLNQKVTDRLTFGMNLNLSYTRVHDAGDGGLFSSPIIASFLSSPLQGPYKDDGTLYTGMEPGFNPILQNNFLYSSKLNFTTLSTLRAIAQGKVSYKLFDWLSIQEKASIDLVSGNLVMWRDPTTLDGIDSRGDRFESNPRQRNFNNQIMLSGSRTINGEHHFDYALINEYSNGKSESFSAEGQGFATGNYIVLGDAAVPIGVGGSGTSNSFLSYLAQLTYSYKDKYNLTGSIRRDGSSRFGVNNRWATFGALGASWNITKEAFMEQQHAISSLKLRASWGTSGNGDFDDFLAYPLYSYGSNYDGIPGSIPSTFGNADLTWEKSKQYSIGLDFGLLKDRITGSIDWYNRKTVGMIYNLPISSTNGFTTKPANIGDLSNKGWEVLVSSKNIVSENDGFTWSTDVNLGINKNKVLSLFEHQPTTSSLTQTLEGYPVSTWYLREWAGVDPETGDAQWYDADGNKTSDYNSAPRKLLGNALPKLQGGVTNTFTYKGVGLSIFLYGATGNKIFNQNAMFIDNDGTYFGYNTPGTYMADFWKKPGDHADRPLTIPGGNGLASQLSSRYLEDGDFLRLKNITLSYNLPQELLKKISFKAAKVFVQANNIITWTGYQGWDPEQDTGANDVFKYPVSKSVQFGVNLTF